MRSPGKTVVDEFYIHLSALEHVQNEDARETISRAASNLSNSSDLEPNVAKLNVRTRRVSLLAYRDFFDAPFPVLIAAWIFPPRRRTLAVRRYDQSLNPPILHRKELCARIPP